MSSSSSSSSTSSTHDNDIYKTDRHDAIVLDAGIDIYAPFSNYTVAPMYIDGIRYRTVFHYYEAMKVTDVEHRDVIRCEFNVHHACLSVASPPNGVSSIRADWVDAHMGVMFTALEAKFSQHARLRRLLCETSTKHLFVFTQRTDPFWGCGPDGHGSNHMGIFLMQIRESLIRCTTSAVIPYYFSSSSSTSNTSDGSLSSSTSSSSSSSSGASNIKCIGNGCIGIVLSFLEVRDKYQARYCARQWMNALIGSGETRELQRIRTIIQHLGVKVEAFDAKLIRSNAVISGSVMDPSNVFNDIDVFQVLTIYGSYSPIGGLLTNTSQSYEVPVNDQAAYRDIESEEHAIASVKDHRMLCSKKIQLITVRCPYSIQWYIHKTFDLDARKCWYDGRKIVTLYPDAVKNKTTKYTPFKHTTKEREEARKDKYKKRGWTVMDASHDDVEDKMKEYKRKFVHYNHPPRRYGTIGIKEDDDDSTDIQEGELVSDVEDSSSSSSDTGDTSEEGEPSNKRIKL